MKTFSSSQYNLPFSPLPPMEDNNSTKALWKPVYLKEGLITAFQHHTSLPPGLPHCTLIKLPDKAHTKCMPLHMQSHTPEPKTSR